MKKLMLSLLVTFMVNLLFCQTTVTIGDGTDSQPYPFNLWGGYARSAAIYTSTEIGSSGLITSLAWDVVTADIEYCPIKIYLKITTNGALYSTNWDALTTGATVVYDATATFQSTGWQTIDVSDFVYTKDGGRNLLVLCEANYGGNGAPSNPVFSYSYSVDKHETWQQYETPPTDPGSMDVNRPNIKITYYSISNPYPPSGFFAQGSGTGQIDLAWTKNAANNNVMVAFNTVNVFGTPSGSYSPGNAISGGGTVLYNGSATGFSHTTGLNPATTYFYKAWSVLPPSPAYSVGSSTSATTLCAAMNIFPITTDFETPTFPPVCWSITQKPWIRVGTVSAFGNGTGSVCADFFNIPAGNSFDLVSPTLDLSGLTTRVVSFDHAYATYASEVDVLELWWSSDDGMSYTLLTTWLGGAIGPLNTGGLVGSSFVPTSGQWASKSYALPAGTNKILFRGVSAWGNKLYLDNITIGDGTSGGDLVRTWNGSASTQWNNASNWSPNGVPLGTHNVTISSGKPNYPVITATGQTCKDLLIKAGANLTVSSGFILIILGNMIIENGAALNNNGTVNLKGNLTNQNTN